MNTYHWIQSLTAVVLLSLYGCNAAPEAPANDSSAATMATVVASKSSGVVETAAGRYTFAPTTCAIHREGDVMDIEIGGPGKAPDGEKIYVEFSSTADTLSVELGVDTPFASSERTLNARQFVSRMNVSGKTIRVADLELVDHNGARQSGSLQIDC